MQRILTTSTLLAGLALTAPVLAQAPRVERMPASARYAGTYHVSTGSWTRGGTQSPALGPDVIYRCDYESGYFSVGWPGCFGVDEGILPSTSNPVGGPQDVYLIDGFTFAYCSQSAGPVDWDFRFYDSYQPCDDPSAPSACINEVGSVAVPGAPAGGCWIVSVDLTGGDPLCMQADGGPCAPGYDGGWLDHFGFGMRYLTPDGLLTGPLLTADLVGVPEGEGTCYSPTLTCPAGASGLGSEHLLFLSSPCNPGCYWGSQPSGLPCGPYFSKLELQHYLVLHTDCSLTCDPCPALRYCSPALANSTGDAGSLVVDQCSLSSEVTLTASRLPSGRFGYLLVGDGAGIVVSPPGSVGDLCLGGSPSGIGRYRKDIASSGPGGVIATALIGGATGGGSGKLPSPPGGTLQPGQTWNFQLWHRDGGSSNFTDAIALLFLP